MVWGALVGPVLLTTLWLEQRRLRRGWTYEPPTFYETNKAVSAASGSGQARPGRAHWVEPRVVRQPEARTA